MRDSQPTPDRRGGVQSIARAAAILRALEASPGGLSLGEIASAVELPKSTVHRLAAALAAEELLAQSADGLTRLGPGLERLAAAGREGLAERLRPILLRLRRELDETVDLAVLDGSKLRFIDQVPAPHRLRATSAVGELFPLHCTANGKALLATLPDEEVEKLLPARLPQLTPNTLATRAALLEELSEARRDGFAFDREEHTEGISAIGAALAGRAGPAAAISVPMPTQRFASRGKELSEHLLAAVDSANKLAA